MSEYFSLIQKLFALSFKKNDINLENIKYLSKAFNFPEKRFLSIHVAGTNGKGSISTKIANALILSGYKTALFTSPHIASFRERILINNELISGKDIIIGLKEIFSLIKQGNVTPSFFEIITILAFNYFAKKKVDFAVVETGLGGRLDATNIIFPVLSIISSIRFDHVNVLGNSLEKIAYEKAGIIKSKIPVVIGPYADLKIIRDKANSLKSSLIKCSAVGGFYDNQNSQIAKVSLEELSKRFSVSQESINKAISKRPKCRFEIFENLGVKAVIFDVAHNLDGVKELAKALKIHYPNDKIRVVLGLSKTKDAKHIVKEIANFASFVHIVQSDNLKALSCFDIEKQFIKINYKNILSEKDISKATQKAHLLAKKKNEVLLITGSFYIMEKARFSLGIKELRDRLDLNEKK